MKSVASNEECELIVVASTKCRPGLSVGLAIGSRERVDGHPTVTLSRDEAR